ncbi:hypothetical protein [Azospirillum sp. sgz302134]
MMGRHGMGGFGGVLGAMTTVVLEAGRMDAPQPRARAVAEPRAWRFRLPYMPALPALAALALLVVVS